MLLERVGLLLLCICNVHFKVVALGSAIDNHDPDEADRYVVVIVVRPPEDMSSLKLLFIPSGGVCPWKMEMAVKYRRSRASIVLPDEDRRLLATSVLEELTEYDKETGSKKMGSLVWFADDLQVLFHAE